MSKPIFVAKGTDEYIHGVSSWWLGLPLLI